MTRSHQLQIRLPHGCPVYLVCLPSGNLQTNLFAGNIRLTRLPVGWQATSLRLEAYRSQIKITLVVPSTVCLPGKKPIHPLYLSRKSLARLPVHDETHFKPRCLKHSSFASLIENSRSESAPQGDRRARDLRVTWAASLLFYSRARRVRA